MDTSSLTTTNVKTPEKPGVSVEEILFANHVLKDVITHTPLQRDPVLSARYDCDVYLKREDLQVVRSFKIRGAYNVIRHLPPEKLKRGVVCASAGNHAQGIAFSCHSLQVPGTIFMPHTTPKQKISQVEWFGGSFVEVKLTGDTFDDSLSEALAHSEEHGMAFIHPFEDPKTIAGQGTVALEILNDLSKPADYLFVGIGGGGLAAGVGSYVKSLSPATRVIGVEATGAPSMKRSVEAGRVVPLEDIDKFVDGTAVRKVGELNLEICKEVVDEFTLVPEGKVCTTILNLYNENAIVAEPAGALSIAALDAHRDRIRGKTVVCIVSGGNNDIDRMQEIKERSLIYEGLKHYFTVNFPQRAGALREFLDEVLGPDDDITRFEYTKKNSKENGPALVGIELKRKEDYGPLIERMDKKGFQYIEINKDPHLFNLLI
ncbi:L-threonine ammonia-lyase [Melghirimyces profundicolus]|uniref:L-threonine dehydratase n=1 Tax=Melghirimyces profundicolus TaxID=1242148 RepID=A0A2T6B2T9_9BACL|nr:threonine ammonia-lyase IlvA [Melghirimyces profundicolus]PTX50342.1 L-threonine ammonia-lyase [Melghirimyces profundicolus]